MLYLVLGLIRYNKGPVAKANHEKMNQEESHRIENWMHARIGMQGALYSNFPVCPEGENKTALLFS